MTIEELSIEELEKGKEFLIGVDYRMGYVPEVFITDALDDDWIKSKDRVFRVRLPYKRDAK